MTISLPFAAFFVFLGLRLSGSTSWSWWWVTAPLWGGAAVVLALLLFGGATVLTGFGVAKYAQKKGWL